MTDEPVPDRDADPPLVDQGTVEVDRTHGTNAEIQPALDTDPEQLARVTRDDVAVLAAVDERQAGDPNAISRGRRRATGRKDDHDPIDQSRTDPTAPGPA